MDALPYAWITLFNVIEKDSRIIYSERTGLDGTVVHVLRIRRHHYG
ncbi:MAG: hypothetical protein J7L38_03000 [Thermoproteales archaeon]|nr:hypothetical protein [Thermoproteales archaeon]